MCATHLGIHHETHRSPTQVKQSFQEPPIQKTHWGYGIAIQFVRSAVPRFHRMEETSGSHSIPNRDVPMIIVSNHQNGLMDPLINTTITANHQIHWLTRADIFKKPLIRKLLFGFNQMPIFRLRDRLSGAKERNQRIFEICVERLGIGATIGLFPEGNHRTMKTLRPLKRGVADMVALSIRQNSKMKGLTVLPVGVDYEQYDAFQRRLSYRVGTAVPFEDLYDAQRDQFDYVAFLKRIEVALKNLVVDVQPEERYNLLIPFVRALRTTELPLDAFHEAQSRIQQFSDIPTEAWKTIEKAFEDLNQTKILESARPEDLSLDQASRRKSSWHTWLLAPLALLGGIPSLPLAWFIQKECEKRIKDPAFMSTFKMTSGMFLFPLFWWLQSVVAAVIAGAANDGWSWTAFFGWYAFNLAGSRIAGYWYGLFLDWKGMRQAQKVWSNPEARTVWTHYVQAIRHAASIQS